MVGAIKKENSLTEVDFHSLSNSDEVKKEEKVSDPKLSSKSGSSKKGSSKSKPCCYCSSCCRGQDSDEEHRSSSETQKETVPKTIASPKPEPPTKTESDHEKKIMKLEPVPSTSPDLSPVNSIASSASHPIKHYKTPKEFETFDPEPLMEKTDPEVLEEKLSIETQKKIKDELEPKEVDDKPQSTPHHTDESDSDDSDEEVKPAFHADKLSVERNDKKDIELLERRKNSKERFSDTRSGLNGDRPAEYLQLSRSKSKSDSSHTLSNELREKEKDSAGSDLQRPACFGCRLKVMSWLKKKP